ncbi:MAG: hypothetical protein MJ168_09890 [Clostridia bacterium]|nr:hypothetical protein [Clostridia bacterium]
MKISKKILSVLLCVVMIFSVCTAAFGAYAKDTKEVTPIVFIPGIGQSQTYKYDDEGNVIADWNLFHITFDTETITFAQWVNLVLLVTELVTTIAIQKDVVTRAPIDSLFTVLMADHLVDENGDFINNVVCPNYPCSIKDYDDEARRVFNSRIPCQELVDEVGEENIYCFNYSVFSNVDNNARNLNDYIEKVVLPQTGAEKVILVPMSMGASLVNNYLNLYPDAGRVEKVISIVGAWQGSDVFGDLLLADFDENAPDLCYTDAINNIGLFGADENYIGYLINIAVRILPKQEVDYLLYDILDGLLETVIIKNTAFMALCPPDRFEQVADKFYNTEETADLRAQAARYADAQRNLESRLKYQEEKYGTEFYFISGYNMQFGDGEFGFFKFFETYDTTNSDEVIQISSTAPGTSYVPAGTKFDDAYIADPAHNCSPDGSIDASTCYYEDTSWYFEGQMHELNDNNSALSLAFNIALGKIKSVDDCKDTYPQFNEARNIRRLTRDYLPDAKSIDTSVLDAADAARLEKAIADAEAMIARTVNNKEKDDEIIQNLLSLLKVLNAKYNLFEDKYQPDKQPSAAMEVLTVVLKIADEVLLKIFDKGGFVEIIDKIA